MHATTAIDRFLAAGLGRWAEARMRRHLSRCERCRGYYDEQLVLHRALAGDPAAPTAGELERMVGRALRGAGAPARASIEKPQAPAALAWHPVRWAMAAAAVVIVTGALVVGFSPRAPAARVVRAEGLRADGVALLPGAELPAGLFVEVGREGLAELALVRGGRVRVFPGSALSLAARGETVELDRGRIWCDIDPKVAPFEVRTGEARARVLGTSFVVERFGAAATEVRVARGKVEVEDVGGRGRVLLSSGQKSRVAQGAAPSPPARYSPDADRSAWQGFMDGLRRVGRWIGDSLQKGLELFE